MTTQTPAPEAVAARLEALERQVGEVLPKNRTVEAEKVLLRDRQGTVRAWLGLLADGSPGLMLVDREGQGGIALSAAADGAAALGFYDPAGRARVRLAVETDGARLVLYDPGGRVIARLPAAPGAAGEEVRIAVEDVPSEGEALLSRIGRTVSAWVAQPLPGGLGIVDRCPQDTSRTPLPCAAGDPRPRRAPGGHPRHTRGARNGLPGSGPHAPERGRTGRGRRSAAANHAARAAARRPRPGARRVRAVRRTVLQALTSTHGGNRRATGWRR